jgi:hypothetical protein
MPTTKFAAEKFVREVSEFARNKRDELKIDRNDVDLNIRVRILSSVEYDEHEDED